VDVLAVQREVLDPAEYVATWLRDAGERGTAGYLERYDGWLAALEGDRVGGVGFGFLVVRRTGADRRITTLDWPHPVEQPLGPHLAAWLDRQRWLAARQAGDALAAATVTLAADVVQVGSPGAEDPEQVVLRQQVGLRRAFASDTPWLRWSVRATGGLPWAPWSPRCARYWGTTAGATASTVPKRGRTCWRRSGC
jgi:hypothetical protein